MASFGDKLREERERRDKALEEIARSSKIGVAYLEALERDDFDALPGPAFGKLYIRAYGKILGFDPDPLLEDYDEERWRRVREERDAERAEREETAREETLEAAREDMHEVAREAGQELSASAGQPEPIVESAPPLAETEPDAVVDQALERPLGSDLDASAVEAPDTGMEATRTEEARREPWADETHHAPRAEEPLRAAETRRVLPIDGTRHALRVVLGARRTAIVMVLVAAGLLALAVWVSIAFLGADAADITPPSDSTSAMPASAGGGEEVAGAPTPRSGAIDQATRTSAGEELPGQEAAASPDTARSRIPAEPVEAVSSVEEASFSAALPGGLTVSDSGVGTRIVNRRLEGRGNRFDEGEVVWFSTQVLGGEAGQSIRHVWLYRGGAVQSIELELGGPHWRTHSRKTLWGRGKWAVEARDASGRVLARAEFSCVPAGRSS
jgi:cytoskeletal protein RodZ